MVTLRTVPVLVIVLGIRTGEHHQGYFYYYKVLTGLSLSHTHTHIIFINFLVIIIYCWILFLYIYITKKKDNILNYQERQGKSKDQKIIPQKKNKRITPDRFTLTELHSGISKDGKLVTILLLLILNLKDILFFFPSTLDLKIKRTYCALDKKKIKIEDNFFSDLTKS